MLILDFYEVKLTIAIKKQIKKNLNVQISVIKRRYRNAHSIYNNIPEFRAFIIKYGANLKYKTYFDVVSK